MKTSNKLYVAYGSNLNLRQMEYRCPYAVPVGPSALSDYRLLFRGHSGVATVEPQEGSTVPVLVWEITPRDEEALDHYEGWPHLYRKEMVMVSLKGKPVQAMIYIMNDGFGMGPPSDYYLNIILEGYTSAGFDRVVLNEAIRESVSQTESD